MDDGDDRLLVAKKTSPVTDRLSRVLHWLGLFVALGLLAWAVVQAQR
jgi:hypothetical protein